MNTDPNVDPDPAFQVNLRSQSGSRVLMTKNLRKKIQQTIFFSFFDKKKIAVYLQYMSKLREKPSALTREHPALKKMKFINFFLCLWVIFTLLDPDTDPGTPLNPDPDPLHWT
jgi:hypothetical protein